jgi:hypothetical protein
MNKQLFEMAILGRNIHCGKDKKNSYSIQLHGGNDRIYPPHIHIYKEGVSKSAFSIEINLAFYLSDGYIQFCRIIDGNIDYKTPEKCIEYKGVRLFVDMMQTFLQSKPTVKEFTDCRDNLEAALRAFADEADMSQLHADDKKEFAKRYQGLYTNMSKESKILFVMMSMHKTINKKFFSYFDKGLLGTFKRAFDY